MLSIWSGPKFCRVGMGEKCDPNKRQKIDMFRSKSFCILHLKCWARHGNVTKRVYKMSEKL